MPSIPQDENAVKLNLLKQRMENDLSQLKNSRKTSNNLNSAEKAIRQVTAKVRQTGNIPENFLASSNQILVEVGSEYLASALTETRNRLSRYHAASNRLG